jgi:hypothetical protein
MTHDDFLSALLLIGFTYYSDANLYRWPKRLQDRTRLQNQYDRTIIRVNVIAPNSVEVCLGFGFNSKLRRKHPTDYTEVYADIIARQDTIDKISRHPENHHDSYTG